MGRHYRAGQRAVGVDGWRIEHSPVLGSSERPALEEFRHLTRDIYIASGDVYFWQGAIREPHDPDRQFITDQLAGKQRIVIDLLYGDQHGGQRVISRFSLLPREDERFLLSLARQWNLDRPDPR